VGVDASDMRRRRQGKWVDPPRLELREYFLAYSPQAQVSAALGFISPISSGEAHYRPLGLGSVTGNSPLGSSLSESGNNLPLTHKSEAAEGGISLLFNPMWKWTAMSHDMASTACFLSRLVKCTLTSNLFCSNAGHNKRELCVACFFVVVPHHACMSG